MKKSSLIRRKRDETAKDNDGLLKEMKQSTSVTPPRGSALAQTPHTFTDSPLFLTTALSHLHDALEMIPEQSKKDYMEAVRLAPSLIKAESDPIKFLRSEGFNPWQAARKLVLHWEYRKWLFQNRWLLPLNESGAGALNENDIDLLRRGWLTYVPTEDPKLGNFYLIDHGRYNGHSFDSFLRVAFYLGTVAQDIVGQSAGVTSIRLISSKNQGGEPPFTVELYKTAKACWKMSKEALPMNLKRVLFLKEERHGKGNMVHMFLTRVGSTVMQVLGNDTPVTVSVPSADRAADVLVEMGIPRDILPTSHGGTWTYDRIFEWKQVIAKEKDPGKLVKIPWLAESRVEVDDDRDKAVAALYARRAYHKRRLRQSQTQEDVQKLQFENKRLRQESVFLESLLQQADNLITSMESKRPDSPFNEPLDALSFEPFGESWDDAILDYF